MAAASWYHRDISRVVAEGLLAKAGRDGCFLVRDSESVSGAYALCLLFQRHVHTYRILPDDEGLLSVQQNACPLPATVTRPSMATRGPIPMTEIDFTLAGLETLARVFDPPASPRSPAREQGLLTSDPDLELLLNKISTVNHLLSSLEKKLIKYQSVQSKVRLVYDREPQRSLSKDFVFPNARLIKYQSVQSKVRLVYDREPQRSLSKDFVFPNARKREAFCQLLQLMKIQHSNLDEPELISVYVGTWNMGSTPPPRSLASWLTSRGLGRTQDETTACIPHDIYVIGTQENSLGDREWVEFLRASLKTLMAIDYRVVALQCLWSIKIVVLVKPEHERRISHVHTSSVKTGIANTLGNKGAVGVSFLFNGTSFGFVNCHLASGSEKTHRRNQNYSDILRSLVLGDKRLSAFDLTLRFTHLFWFGDLNYRLDMDVQDILAHITKKEFEALLAVDQLNLEREKNKVFLRFSEGDISFPPTYRYERGSRDSYMWQKFKPTGMRINVPSWCDRILWKSHPETHVVCNSYGCTDDIVTSDHSPVFATFEVGVTSQFVPKKGKSRPRSLPEPTAGYTNPAYFIFEGVPNTWVPAPSTSEAHDKQLESPARDQRRQSPLGARVPSPSEEERWGSRPCCVPGGPSRGCPLSPPGAGRQKRPKSAVLARDPPGLGDCSLTALHMATCLSQLDRASPERRGDSQKTLLRQTHSRLEPPPWPCREVPRCTPDAHQHGHPREWPCDRGELSRSVGGCLGHLGLQQDMEVLQGYGWDPLEIFREVTERDLLEAGLLSLSHPWLIHGKLGEGSAVSLPRRPDLGPSA
ncbi:phosphatidylinositol 3,4,5-trisphosphate 5-phosphatase 2 [Egretta garzetta]|uniref:phosphatidylinositol 3,4,5-trisphosphate 5-phosphatase 2 n=1 Tax=Egretta garzetta TaxID=188379 RepID=UPI00163BC8CF|nr:phosphatidylinositol 3,4,5-trisphosphate 5-phosphatase 2 [Egretta garzetta]